MTAADVTLASFSPSEGVSGWNYYTDYVATLKANGNIDKRYGYISAYWAGEYWDASAQGWYDFAFLRTDPETITEEQVGNTKIPYGTAFLVYTAKSGVTITFAGEVLEDDIAIALNENANTFVGNARPTAVKLGEISATDGISGWNYYTDFLATLKTNGNIDNRYGYISAYWAGEYWNASAQGWYDFAFLRTDPETITEDQVGDAVEFNPGDGFLVYVGKPNIELLVPSAL